MLEIEVRYPELYKSDTNEFIKGFVKTLIIEHSLFSISKWERIWEIPWLSKEAKTDEQTLSYIKCMTINHKQITNDIYEQLDSQNFSEIDSYINKKNTATIIYERANTSNKQTILTSELIYSKMIDAGIPMEFDKWHFNSLMMLLRVRGVEAQPKKNKDVQWARSEQHRINELNKKRFNSNG